MGHRGHRSLAGWSVAAALLTHSPGVKAADSDAQIAQSLFDEGRVLLEAGRYAEACPKLAESQRLDPGGGTLLNLALCHEREGKTATAWLEFRDALAQAERDRRDDRIEFAKTHIGALEPKLVRLAIIVPDDLAVKAPLVELDSSRVPREAWGTALPVDPGDHRIVARLGEATWSTTISATAPARIHEVVVQEPSAPKRPAMSVERHRSTAFWLTLGGAGALAATSAITGLVALDANGYVNDHCSAERDFCWANADDERSRARTFAWISTATLGGAVVTAAIAFLLPRTTRQSVSAGIVLDGARAIGALRVDAF